MDDTSRTIWACVAALRKTIEIIESYSALKAVLVDKYGAESELVQAIEKLEENPSISRAGLLTQKVAAVRADKDSEIRKSVRALSDGLEGLLNACKPSSVPPESLPETEPPESTLDVLDLILRASPGLRPENLVAVLAEDDSDVVPIALPGEMPDVVWPYSPEEVPAILGPHLPTEILDVAEPDLPSDPLKTEEHTLFAPPGEPTTEPKPPSPPKPPESEASDFFHAENGTVRGED